LGGLAKSLLRKFHRHHYTSHHTCRTKRTQAKGGKSLRDYYRRFSELRAQVYDITKREVIETFSHGVMAKWQFQDFCKKNPMNNEEFRHAVQNIFMVEERIREIFLDRNNRENNRVNSDRRSFLNIGHPNRKRGPDNTIAMADKTKFFSKFRRFEDIENMHCI
jgi:hypothetical protein